MRMDTRFFDLVRAVRNRMGPEYVPSKFLGSHASPATPPGRESGASLIIVAGVKPFSSAAEYMKGLMLITKRPEALCVLRVKKASEV